MNQCYRIAALIVLLSRLYSLPAQVGFSIPITSNVHTGDILDLPIKVVDFDSITAVQFVLRWDPSVLQFQSVGQYNLPDLDDGEFGMTNTLDSGFIRFAWVYYTPSGTTLADNSAIFHLKLKVIGPINSGTPIRFTELPPLTYFEVVNAKNISWGIQSTPIMTGFVAVGYTYSATQTPDNQPVVSVFPNPAKSQAWAWIELPTAETLRVSLGDASGQIIWETEKSLPAGRNGIEIACPEMDRKGIFFLIIQSAHFQHAQPVIFAD